MKQLNKCVLFFIVLFLNTTYLFADIGNRGRWDNGGTSNFECPYGYFWVLSQEDSLHVFLLKTAWRMDSKTRN